MLKGWLSRCLLLALCCAGGFAWADDADEDEDSLPGLIGKYSAGKLEIERIDAAPAWMWGAEAPDPRLPNGAVYVTWKGRLLIREAGRYRFSAFGNGNVRITLGGKIVLTETGRDLGWMRGEEVALDFGEQPIQIDFQKTNFTTQMRLFWSSDAFPIEPLPDAQLYRDEVRPELKLWQRGRELFDAHRCAQCHRPAKPTTLPAPALTGRFREWNPAWLADWLQHPDRLDKHAKMPSMGINSEEAQAIAAALVHQHPVAPPAQGPKWAENVAAGEVLFHSLGCLACHTRGDDGNAPTWGGGDLTDVGRKRSEKWLKTWLQKPEEIAPQRRMPTFELSTAEVTVLAAYLAGAEPAVAPQPDAKLVERGNQLLDAFRCGQCHELPAAPQAPEITVLREQADWSRSCLAAEPDPQRHRPAFPQLTESDREALRNYLASIRQLPSPESEFERGRQLLAQKNCIACHPREASAGLVPTAGAISRKDPALAGQSEALIPPSLNAVGDRLPDDVLKSAISGAQARRLPWLKVRMPRYQHSEAEQAALVKFLIGHDRIPDGAPVAPRETNAQEQTAAQRTESLLAGHTLVGGAGFSCVACHRFGKFEPRNVALGTRGSDLMQIGKRMRREYFLRWTRSPLRIVRDMEMPSFDKPMAGVLGGDIDRQLQALWEAVNDPDFTVPADPSVIEQALRVSPGNPARVVRDVFWLSDGDRDRYVARAFAVGLGNQQNVLFDLDSMSLREWWVGDFATQRTQGKSWYWQPGGVRLVEGLGDLPSFVMKSPAGKALLTPHFEQGTCGRLQSYAPSAHGINLRYTIAFQADDKPLEIQINETWTPLAGTTEKPIGWKRSIVARGIPEGYGLHLHWPELKNRVGTASVSTAAEAATLGLGDGKSGRYVPIAVSNDGARTIEIEYRNTAQPPPGNLPARPVQVAKAETLDVLPGYDAQRLPLDRSIMPTAIAWRPDGTMVFTSLKGHVYLARDTDGDGVEDSLSVFEEGLAAPYGVLADGNDVLVSHKPELLRLRDTDGDGRADVREVVATGWGYSDNYHDWTCGIVRDSRGNLYVGLGSDYTQPKRAKETTRWRGTVLQVAPSGKITPIGSAFRYPTGLAIREDDEIFVSDNQGVQNTFNEINHLRLGAHYGVPSVDDAPHTTSPELPAIQVPHPWTRSVNGLVFLPQSGENAPKFGPFAGHGIGCEYDSRFLMRFTLQRVGETFQGAAYPFSVPTPANGVGFDGTLCAGVSPRGDLYVGCIHDSGWLGGLNVGNIVRLRPNGAVPAGIRTIEADATGFRVAFTQPVDSQRAGDPAAYSLSAYTRVWEGAYATPDSQRHRPEVTKVRVSDDRLSVRLEVDRLREGFVYELTVGRIGSDPNLPLWPTVGHYTMNRIPAAEPPQPR